jgi:hypothetical protein
MVRPVPDQSWVSKSATETTSPVALGSAVQKGRHPSGSVRLRGTKGNPPLGEGCGGVPGPCAVRARRLIGVEDMCNSPLRLGVALIVRHME